MVLGIPVFLARRFYRVLYEKENSHYIDVVNV